MLEAYGNIWDNLELFDALVITTNGFIKNNGEAVMGRGIALQAKERFPSLPKKLGLHLQLLSNHVGIFTILPAEYHLVDHHYYILTMPVKPDYVRTITGMMPGWRAKADIKLIERSAKELVQIVDVKEHQINSVLMPRPGCGNGGLKWEVVKPIIAPILDDRFTVMTYDN